MSQIHLTEGGYKVNLGGMEYVSRLKWDYFSGCL